MKCECRGLLRQVTTVSQDGWIDVTSRKTHVTFYRCPSGTVRFPQVSRIVMKTKVKPIRVAYILIITFLLKLSSQWVKYALGCVYIDLPISEMKKKKIAKMSEFIHNLARSCRATACFLPSVVCHGRGKLPKRKVRPSSNVDLFMYKNFINIYLDQPK